MLKPRGHAPLHLKLAVSPLCTDVAVYLIPSQEPGKHAVNCMHHSRVTSALALDYGIYHRLLCVVPWFGEF